MSRKPSLVDSFGTGEVSASSMSTVTGTLLSSPSAPPTAPARTPVPDTRRASFATGTSSPTLSPEVVGTKNMGVEKQLFRSHALPPPADGVVGVVVRVRPFSTKERADPSTKTCVQCLKDSVILGGITVPRSGSLGSVGHGGLDDKTIGRPLPILKTRMSGEQGPSTTTTTSSASTSAATRRQQFSADQVFHQSTSQVDVYEQACRHIVEGVFQGVNGSILAYGATGSGKTHTMFGGPLSAAGVVYQAVRDIFDEKVRLEEEANKLVNVKCSFVEIYNEEVFDLLAPTPASAASPTASGLPRGARNSATTTHRTAGSRFVNGRPALQVRDVGTWTSTSASSAGLHGEPPRPSTGTTTTTTTTTTSTSTSQAAAVIKKKKGRQSGGHTDLVVNPESLVISGLTYTYPTSLAEFAHAIEQGHTNRFTAATGANAHSSRSHAIITVEVQVLDAAGQQGSGGGTVARIRFCDLAGSERAAMTSNTGVRLREGGNINRSLLALGAVVQALAQQARYPSKAVFVPYRGSKLTRLLRDGIGGNCRTQMLFCLSPSARQYEESVNTMVFAMQAKEIHVTAKRNAYQVNSAQVAKNQEEIIEELRADLAAAREALWQAQGGGPEGSEPPSLSRHSSVLRLHGTQSGASLPSTVPAGGLTEVSTTAALMLPLLSRPEPLTTTTATAAAASSIGTNFPSVSDLSGRLPTYNGTTIGSPMSPPASQLLEAPALVADTASGRGVGSGRSGVFGGALGATTTAAVPTSGSGYSRGRSVTPSPGFGGVGRPSVFQDSANLFSDLEAKFKAFTEEKKTVYHLMRDTQGQCVQLDMDLRDQKWKLARFLASGALGDMQRGGLDADAETTSSGTVVTPVGVAGLRQVIAEMEATTAQEDDRTGVLEGQMDDIDRRIADAKRELLREKQYTALELLLDNANLRQNGTEAESLAAHYHQQWHRALKRQEEYAQALEAATEALRAALQLLPADSQAAEQSRLALVYAELPTTTTAEMIPVFERALKRQRPQPLHDGAKSVSILVPPSGRGLGETGHHSRTASGSGLGALGMPPLPNPHGFVRTPSSSLVLASSSAVLVEVPSPTRHYHPHHSPAGATTGAEDLAHQFQQLVDTASQLGAGALPDGVVARGRRGSHAGQTSTSAATSATVPAATRRAARPTRSGSDDDDEDNDDVSSRSSSKDARARAAEEASKSARSVGAKPNKEAGVSFDLPQPSQSTTTVTTGTAPISTAAPTTAAREGRTAKRLPSFSRSYSTSGFQRGKTSKKKDTASSTAAGTAGEGKKGRIMKSARPANTTTTTTTTVVSKKRPPSSSASHHTDAGTGAKPSSSATPRPPPDVSRARRASAPAFTFADNGATKTRVARLNAATMAAAAATSTTTTTAGEPKKAKERLDGGGGGAGGDAGAEAGAAPTRFRRTVTDTAKLSASPMLKATAPSPERAEPPTSSGSPRDRLALGVPTPVRENAASKLRQAAVQQAAQRNHDPYLPVASPTRPDTDKRRPKKKTSTTTHSHSHSSAPAEAAGRKLPKLPRDLAGPASPTRRGAAAPRRAHSAFSRSQTAGAVPSSESAPFYTSAKKGVTDGERGDRHAITDTRATQSPLFARRASSTGRVEVEKRAHAQEEHFQALFDLHEQILGSRTTTPHRSRSAQVTQERRRDGAGDEGALLKEHNPSARSSATAEEGLTDRPSV